MPALPNLCLSAGDFREVPICESWQTLSTKQMSSEFVQKPSYMPRNILNRNKDIPNYRIDWNLRQEDRKFQEMMLVMVREWGQQNNFAGKIKQSDLLFQLQNIALCVCCYTDELLVNIRWLTCFFIFQTEG